MASTTVDLKNEVRTILGNHSSAEFMALSREERNTVYKRYLIAEETLHEGTRECTEDELRAIESFASSDIRRGALLRMDSCVGGDSAGQKIVREARKVYYSKNTFALSAGDLRGFLVDTVQSWVRKIVTAPIEFTNYRTIRIRIRIESDRIVYLDS